MDAKPLLPTGFVLGVIGLVGFLVPTLEWTSTGTDSLNLWYFFCTTMAISSVVVLMTAAALHYKGNS